MQEYMPEVLWQGLIIRSMSPVSVVFFFVKKDSGLHLCINYHGINEVTVKIEHPLPLVPATIDQLSSASIFSKLDPEACTTW